jgi:hypothetical protein
LSKFKGGGVQQQSAMSVTWGWNHLYAIALRIFASGQSRRSGRGPRPVWPDQAAFSERLSHISKVPMGEIASLPLM